MHSFFKGGLVKTCLFFCASFVLLSWTSVSTSAHDQEDPSVTDTLDPATSCGDVSGNGFTDMTDLVVLANHWLRSGSIGGVPNPDYYPDGHIDLADFCFTAVHWMQCCRPPYPPEIMEYYYLALLQRCASRVKTIAVTIELYSNDIGHDFPPALQTLIDEGYLDSEPFPGEMLMCPSVCPHIQASDYVYRASDLHESRLAVQMILVHDPFGNHANGMRNVAFVDLHVESMTEAEFQAAVEEDNARQASLRLSPQTSRVILPLVKKKGIPRNMACCVRPGHITADPTGRKTPPHPGPKIISAVAPLSGAKSGLGTPLSRNP